jgi:phosphodiester glycosidase
VAIPDARRRALIWHQHIAVVAVLPVLLTAPASAGAVQAALGRPVRSQATAAAAGPWIDRVGWVWHLHWTSHWVTQGVMLRRGVLRGGGRDPLSKMALDTSVGIMALDTRVAKGQPPGAEQVREAIISPRAFRGRVEVMRDGPVAGQHTASAVAAARHASVVVNGGFFIVSGADGYLGAPAGLAVYHGELESMSAGARGALILGEGPPRIEHLISTASVRAGGAAYPVQGINRLPGVIEDCGRPGSRPFRGPRQDVTCYSRSELVLFTPQLGAATPAGPGFEVTAGPRGTVHYAGPRRAGRVPAHGVVIQGLGAAATWLSRHARPGRHLAVRERVADRSGQPVPLRPWLSIASAAPVLLSHGHFAIDGAAEGVTDPRDPAFGQAWARERQPRTMAGIGRRGQLILVTVDGRQPGYSDGATLVEGAALMRALGAVSALNLDGGGSTAMAVRGALVSHPSDGSERADGDFVLAIPRPRQGPD